MQMAQPWSCRLAALFGLLSAVGGLALAILLEMPPGPAMAATATIFYLLAALFSPKKGLVFRFFQKRKLQAKIRLEDALKQAFRLQQKGQLNLASLLEKVGFNQAVLNRQIQILRSKGWMEQAVFKLTQEGQSEAKRLVRAHRLWESYLVNQVGLSAEQIHEDAEKYEHLLTDEILDEVDRTLGYPTTDPHGSPIPARRGLPAFSLMQLAMAQPAKIASKQPSKHVTARLWQLGLLPDSNLLIKQKTEGYVEVEQAGKTVKIPSDLARRINVVN